MDVRIVDEPRSGRFVITVDGTAAGEITYTIHHDRRFIVHTGVHAPYEGAGVGGRAVAALLAEVRARGEQIVPLCPFVRRYIERHPEHRDLVDVDLLAAHLPSQPS